MEFTNEERVLFRSTQLLENLADGQYIGNLSNVKVDFSKGGYKTLFLTYEISNPKESAFVPFIHRIPLTKSIFIIKKIIAKFGLDPKKMEIDHVESEFRKKIGSEVHFSLETNGQYQNCNIESVNTNTLEEWKQQHKQSQQQTELEEDLTF